MTTVDAELLYILETAFEEAMLSMNESLHGERDRNIVSDDTKSESARHAAQSRLDFYQGRVDRTRAGLDLFTENLSTLSALKDSGNSEERQDAAHRIAMMKKYGTEQVDRGRECLKLNMYGRQKLQDEHDSFERCDTDGALSQWASQKSWQESREKARLVMSDGMHIFPALFDLKGSRLPYKLVTTTNSYTGSMQDSWVCFDSEYVEQVEGMTKWFNPSRARNETMAKANDAKKGYYVGSVVAPAYIASTGDLVTLTYYPRRCNSEDFSAEIILDNGQF